VDGSTNHSLITEFKTEERQKVVDEEIHPTKLRVVTLTITVILPSSWPDSVNYAWYQPRKPENYSPGILWRK